MLQIQLLGDFKITDSKEPIPGLTKPRMQTLLAYLLLHADAPQSRAHLAYTFWPDSTDAQARTNLRRELLQLRRVLPRAEAYLRIETQTIQWNPEADFSLDVVDFSTALAEAKRSTDAQEQAQLLAQAADIYRGDLLPGHYEEWILTKREELAQQFVQTLEQLVDLHIAQRNFSPAIQAAQELLRYDPLYEAGYYQLMELYAYQNERARALHTYHTYASLLERELGVEPGPEIQELYDQLRRAETVAEVGTGRKATEAMQLVGRTSEWQTLLDRWRRSSRDRAGFVLIEGEAGIGKTRLGEELLEWVNRQGIPSARTRSYAAEGSLAYAPVIEWLRSDILRGRLESLDTAWLTEIARLLPELLSANPRLPPPEPLTEQWQRQRLFEALARAVTIDAHPLLLLIDDLQWSDQETLEWLRFLLRYDENVPLLVVGTARPEEIPAEHPLRALLNELSGSEQLTTIPLAPLNHDETRSLAEQVCGKSLDDRESAHLFVASEGYPLFVVEMVRAGYHELAPGDEAEVGVAASDAQLPPRVHAVIQSRLDKLSPTAHKLVDLAATIGRSFSYDVLAAASGENDDAVTGCLDELWQRRIIVEQGIAAYDFSHDRIRDVAYAAISPIRRRVLHRQVAEALQQRHAADLDPVSGQLAHHYERAGLFDQAIHYHRRAAAVALRTYANEDAVFYLTRAIDLLRASPTTADKTEQELALQLELSAALQAARGMTAPEVEAAYQQAIELVRRGGGSPALFPAQWGLWVYRFGLADHRAALEVGRDLLASAKELGVQDLILQGHHTLWTSSFTTGHFVEALAHCRQGTAIYEPERHHPQLSRFGVHDVGVCSLSFTGPVLWLLGYADQAIASDQEALDLSRRFGHPATLAQPLIWGAILHQLLRDPETVRTYVAGIRRITANHSMPSWHGWDKCLLGWAEAMQGQLDRGIEQIQRGLDDDLAYHSRLLKSYFLTLLAEAFSLAGQTERAMEVLESALAEIDDTGECWFAAEAQRLHGNLLLEQGAAEKAEGAYLEAMATAGAQQAKSLELRIFTALCRLWQSQGKRAQAHQHLAELYNWFTEGFDTHDLQTAKALLDQLG